jgi:hypothetical protein
LICCRVKYGLDNWIVDVITGLSPLLLASTVLVVLVVVVIVVVFKVVLFGELAAVTTGVFGGVLGGRCDVLIASALI